MAGRKNSSAQFSGRATKYHNEPVIYDGMRFDSKKELRRYKELVILERAGWIKGLRRQVKYTLIPTQYVDGRLAERELYYKADFVYTREGEEIVEDTKGYRTPDYIIKRKMMLHKYGIRIREV